MKNAIAGQNNPMRPGGGMQLRRRQDRAKLQLHHNRRREQLQLSGSLIPKDCLAKLFELLRCGDFKHAGVARQAMDIAQPLWMCQLGRKHLLENAETDYAPLTRFRKKPAKAGRGVSASRRTV